MKKLNIIGSKNRFEMMKKENWCKLGVLCPVILNPQSVTLNLKQCAFTLAEVLITLGIIGIVAAMTLPSMITNIQERVRKEQVRTVKYKLTLATDKMKSLDKIGGIGDGADDTEVTGKFIKELKKHFKIAKVCDNGHLTDCWPTEEINMPDDNPKKVSTLTNGTQLSALAIGSANTKTMGIVTGDGIPMILLYSPVCTPLDPAKTYTWSMVDNKPETNATTNCISAIFDINGDKKPNRLGSDVRTLNSIFGYKQYEATDVKNLATKEVCEQMKKKHLINECSLTTDYYAAAVKKCNDIGLHLPSIQTLSNIAAARYGTNDMGSYTIIGETTGTYTRDYFERTTSDIYYNPDDFILNENTKIKTGANSSVGNSGHFWSNSEISESNALRRTIHTDKTFLINAKRNNSSQPLCVAD